MRITHKKRNKTSLTRKNYGGKLTRDEVLKKIISIGFEVETGNMIPIKEHEDEPDKYTFTGNADVLQPIYLDDNIIFITSDADTPQSTGGVDSLISQMENNYLVKDKNGNLLTQEQIKKLPEQTLEKYAAFQEFIDTYISVFSEIGDYGFYNHTEYMFTFINSNGSFNNDNIILQYFLFVIEYLRQNFIEFQTISNNDVDSKLRIFKNGDLKYLIPMKFDDDYTPNTIKWVPQMTINVKMIDIIEVILYLSKDLNPDSKFGIRSCETFANSILSPRKIGTYISDLKKTSISETTIENQKNIFAILRNCLFMVMYLIVYGGDSNLGTPFINYEKQTVKTTGKKSKVIIKIKSSIAKNNFDFLFRCSICRIIVSLGFKYPEPDIIACLTFLRDQLDSALPTYIKDKKLYNLHTCNSFIHFINILLAEGLFLSRFSTQMSNDVIDTIFKGIYREINQRNHRPYMKVESQKREIDGKMISDYYLSSNTFFTEIFGNASNYFPYNLTHESILIEYRSFSQNLLIGAKSSEFKKINGRKIYDVYQTLDTWYGVINTINDVKNYPVVKNHPSKRERDSPDSNES